RREANYMVNWGNTNWNQDMTTGFNPFKGPFIAGEQVPFLGAPFTMDKSYGVQSMTDGTSNSLLMAEVIIGATMGATGYEHRGDVYNDDYNCFMFNGYTPPNSTFPDWEANGYCHYPYATNPPCVGPATGGGSNSFNAARSYHPGGVNALLADGSVRFAKKS